MSKPISPTFSSKTFARQSLGVTASAAGYTSGQAIFSQGEVADAIFRVDEGTVKLMVKSKSGRPAVTALLRAGECFGEDCLEQGESLRTSTATSLSQSKITRIGKGVMLRRLQADPALTRLFISHLLLRIARSEGDHADQLLNSSERRLARQLVRLAGLTIDSKEAVPVAMPDQNTLAQMVGTTRARVSHFMNQFRKDGLIDYNGDLRVRNKLLKFLEQGGLNTSLHPGMVKPKSRLLVQAGL